MSFNKEYKEISTEILNNDKFRELKKDNHHGTTRYAHCKRVSYVSFLLAKLLHGNCKEAAVSGLLHDFFHGSTGSDDEISYLNHPKASALNAKKYFEISNKESEIIETHMYHYALVQKYFLVAKKNREKYIKQYKPTSKEGSIVCISDLLVSIFEVICFKVRYETCVYFLFLINLIGIN